MPFNPWDQASRREPKPDIDAFVDLITTIDADGLYLDTLSELGSISEETAVVLENIVLESERPLPLGRIEGTTRCRGAKVSKTLSPRESFAISGSNDAIWCTWLTDGLPIIHPNFIRRG